MNKKEDYKDRALKAEAELAEVKVEQLRVELEVYRAQTKALLTPEEQE